MSVRPQAQVYDVKDGAAVAVKSVPIPPVFSVRVRPDIVKTVVDRLQLSTRQAHGVKEEAGYQTAARSWGTGRAVARVPRVPGGGSYRSGEAAFANFCKGGGMFAPNKTWRRFAKKTTKTTRIHAQAYAISASGCTGMVLAHGHRIQNVPELPLVVTDQVQNISKTAELEKFLKGLGLADELERCVNAKRIRGTDGKGRNRKYLRARGPLIVYESSDSLHRAANCIEGVDVMSVYQPVTRLMAPGQRAGRIIIYTESAFQKLSDMYGNDDGFAIMKPRYKLPRTMMTADSVTEVLSSDAVLSVVRPKMINPNSRFKKGLKANPLRNKEAMAKLNPAAAQMEPLKTGKALRK